MNWQDLQIPVENAWKGLYKQSEPVKQPPQEANLMGKLNGFLSQHIKNMTPQYPSNFSKMNKKEQIDAMTSPENMRKVGGMVAGITGKFNIIKGDGKVLSGLDANEVRGWSQFLDKQGIIHKILKK